MAYAVIGAGYGDEGKGLITDYLVRKVNADTVVRFNGGSQAGHTVKTVDGKSHVFSHIASGHFAGAKTFLGKQFIVNPVAFDREYKKLGGATTIAHPDAQVSLAYDAGINMAIERARGISRHGSCGHGINEAVTRFLSEYGFTVGWAKMASISELKDRITQIREEYIPKRLNELGLELSDVDNNIFNNSFNTINTMTFDVLEFLANISVHNEQHKIKNVVFEGAQGLAIDEFIGKYPHVTRSVTGLPNAIADAAYLGIREITPVYVTRAYTTRHGRGPLQYEIDPLENDIPADTTNIYNEWQEQLRYAYLNISELAERIAQDERRSIVVASMYGVKLNLPKLAITCLDHIPQFKSFAVVDNHRVKTLTGVKDLVQLLEQRVGASVALLSSGPCADDVKSLITI